MTNDKTSGANSAPPTDTAQRRKRFYTKASVRVHDDGFVLLLDGRAAKTPSKTTLVLPTRAAAEAIAAEWQAQDERVDFASMPLTRLANTAIDGVAENMEAVAAEIVKYAETDLVCYRAATPESLVKAETKAWDPILAFAARRLGTGFVCVEGIGFVAQPAAAVAAVQTGVNEWLRIRGAPFVLACLSVMTTLTGSVLITLALANRVISLDEAWGSAHVDEDFQIRHWGEDREAMERRAKRFDEMAAAERLLRLVTS